MIDPVSVALMTCLAVGKAIQKRMKDKEREAEAKAKREEEEKKRGESA